MAANTSPKEGSMKDEFQVRVTSAWFPEHVATCLDRDAAEATARQVARRWERDRGRPVEVQVSIARRQVTPWVNDGEVYELSSTEGNVLAVEHAS